MLKLAALGISGNILSWIKSFLANRSHQTRVGTSLSDILQLITGVIQGSALGPLLFLIFINHLVLFLEKYRATLKLFADDTKLYADIGHTCDEDELQAALDAHTQSADVWQLSISIQKCLCSQYW